MTLNTGIWRLDGHLKKLTAGRLPTEKDLENALQEDPSILGNTLLILGRQVGTDHGKIIDLLAIDQEGSVHVLELKKGQTPRDAVAQLLDYGSWVNELGRDKILEIFERQHDGKNLEIAFAEFFGHSLPEELNASHFLTLVAAELDPASQRIVRYLSEAYGVPINAVFFQYFVDGDREYLTRTWLQTQPSSETRRSGQSNRKREPWNEIDWYVSFGEGDDGRSWNDARTHGFVSAGGGDWYSRTLRKVNVGARVWVCIPKSGYVGVGVVTAPAVKFADWHVETQVPLVGNYVYESGKAEWILPVEWKETRPKDQAVWTTGLFANQNSACPLRNAFTLEILHQYFDVNDA
jgi:hypothetical protein